MEHTLRRIPPRPADVAEELVLYAACLPATPFREYASAAAEAGFDAITIWPLTYRRALSREGLTAKVMRQIADDVGVRIVDLDPCGVWLPEPPADADVPAALRSVWQRHEFFECATALGIECLVAVHLGQHPVDLDAASVGFADLCDDAAEHGLRVALEFMPFSGIRDLSAALHILEQADRPNAGLMLDLWHLARSGGDSSALSSLPPGRVFSVQLSDGPEAVPADLRDEAMWHRLAPGDGAMPLTDALVELARAGVRARVGPELYRQDFSQREPSLVAADLMASTKKVLGRPSADAGPESGE